MSDQLSEIREYSIEEIEAMLPDADWFDVPNPDWHGADHHIYTRQTEWTTFGQTASVNPTNAAFVVNAKPIIRYLLAQLEAIDHEIERTREPLTFAFENGDKMPLGVLTTRALAEIETLRGMVATAEKKLGESEQGINQLIVESERWSNLAIEHKQKIDSLRKQLGEQWDEIIGIVKLHAGSCPGFTQERLFAALTTAKQKGK